MKNTINKLRIHLTPIKILLFLYCIFSIVLLFNYKSNGYLNIGMRLTIRNDSTILPSTFIKDDEKFSRVPLIKPFLKEDFNNVVISSVFGMRVHPITKKNKMHTGIDFSAKMYTRVISTGSGVVKTVVLNNKTGYGNYIIVDHNYGVYTLYAHLEKILVKVGDNVNRYQIIGLVGNTGMTTNSHLHYEIIINGKSVDPNIFFIF